MASFDYDASMMKRHALRRCAAALAALALPVLFASGCKSTQAFKVDPEKGTNAIEEQIRRLQEKVRGIDETKIQKALNARTALRSPVRIAILEMNGAGLADSNQNYARLAELLRSIPGGRLRDVVVLDPRMILGPLNLPDLSLESLRLAAARMDADLLLFIVYDWRMEFSGWPWQFLDLAIVPSLILPSVGVEVEARVFAYGIDVRNESGIVHFAIFEQKGDSSFVPSAWARGRRNALRERLSGDLLLKIVERVRDILGGAAAAEPPAAPSPAAAPKPPEAAPPPASGK